MRFFPRSPALELLEPFLPLLVTGVPGVPGYNAFLYFRRLFPGRVHGLVPMHSELPPFAGEGLDKASGWLRLDPENPAALERLFAAQKYRAVIDASGWCALKAAELDPKLARRLNLDIGLHLMTAARQHGSRLIRLSTDLVFSGRPRLTAEGGMKLGGYVETEGVDPVTVYGKVMAEAEEKLLAGLPQTCVLRVSLPMGPSPNGHAGAIDWIDSRFRRQLPATLYYDEVRTPIYAQDLNALLAELLVLGPQGGAEGILHGGGPLCLSLNQIAQVVNVAGGYAPDLLMGCLRQAAGPMPPRAGDVTMDSSRLRKLLPGLATQAWPAHGEWLPTGIDWHRSQSRLGEENLIASRLFGYDPARWDHPCALLAAPPGTETAA